MNSQLRIILAKPEQLNEYIEFLEDVAVWLDERGIKQWKPGNFRLSKGYYAESVRHDEVWLAYLGAELVGTTRILLGDSIVWPEVTNEDGVYVYNLAVKRTRARTDVGKALLLCAEACARNLKRQYVRLDCMADNEFLKRYYAEAGFTACGEIAAKYPEPIGTLQLFRYQRPLTMT